LDANRQPGKFALLLPGANAKPDDIRFTDTLPKTRSEKIISRLLRELAAGGKVSGDMTSLEDFSVLEKLREGDE
jgi:acetyl-CoA synthetase